MIVWMKNKTSKTVTEEAAFCVFTIVITTTVVNDAFVDVCNVIRFIKELFGFKIKFSSNYRTI